MAGRPEGNSPSDTPPHPDRVMIVHPVLPRLRQDKSFIPSVEDQIEEAEGLAHAIALDIALIHTVRLSKISPSHLIGKGAVTDIAALVADIRPAVVIVNYALSPVQQRNLEKDLNVKVIDRTGLILEIFGARAQTREGKIQVELAAMEYERSRLVRSWTHLERQRGGTGKTGGPGETQLEIDRRLVAERIARLKKELEQVRRNRDIQRKSRERVPFPIVALVGYTNAGKSTLFNRLTGAEVFAEDLLFATLDPTMRRIRLDNGQDIILSDTVGFIADLPTGLVAAFRATLEQTAYADVILHVRDISRPDHEMQRDEVIRILGELGIEYETDDRIIEVMNKIDALPATEREDLVNRTGFAERSVAVSALTGQGADELLRQIRDHVSQGRETVFFRIPGTDGEALAWLHSHGHVLSRREDEDGVYIGVSLDPADIGRFHSRFPYQEVKKPRPRSAERRDA